ncbi:PREDICTED: rab GTPase-activating protein 1-like, partial [Tauraco erythrolophus]|uniref:rab GTPase-activating protein 1-like n=1 Tax=Tauraco erythrolophus TaxID=121530 RepID=UPI0005231FEC
MPDLPLHPVIVTVSVMAQPKVGFMEEEVIIQSAGKYVELSCRLDIMNLQFLCVLSEERWKRHLPSSGFESSSRLTSRMSNAYSVYDEDIGYCQGQSFLAAVLLLHMPEEQAFCVFVKIMYDYGLRDLYRNNFEDLHCKFFQLEKLMQEQLPDLFSHFSDLNLEAHMYASQWFLTLFTAKFPLCMVFHIIDLLLCEGMNIIFHVALALLKTSKEDLLQADFEGALKFFRVQLPKRYRAEENARRLMEQACNIKRLMIHSISVKQDFVVSHSEEVKLKQTVKLYTQSQLTLAVRKGKVS